MLRAARRLVTISSQSAAALMETIHAWEDDWRNHSARLAGDVNADN